MGCLSEDCIERNNLQAQQYRMLATSPDDRLLSIMNDRKDWAVLPPWADVVGTVVDEGPFHYSLVEGYVTPWDALSVGGPEGSQRSQLEDGRVIGFQVSMADFDTKPAAYHGWYTIAGQWDTWRLADNFADARLVSCADPGCSDYNFTAVRTDSWGRIKASFR